MPFPIKHTYRGNSYTAGIGSRHIERAVVVGMDIKRLKTRRKLLLSEMSMMTSIDGSQSHLVGPKSASVEPLGRQPQLDTRNFDIRNTG